MFDLTGFQRDCLIAVAGLEEPHGLAVKDELENYYAGGVHHGRLYPNLDSLVDKGLVAKDQKDRRTNEYTLTEQGRDTIRERRDWEESHLNGLGAKN